MYKERARDRRYLGMTAAMTQLPVPTATERKKNSQKATRIFVREIEYS